jgi:hypothetical protein
MPAIAGIHVLQAAQQEDVDGTGTRLARIQQNLDAEVA